jgi:hypothetical protein
MRALYWEIPQFLWRSLWVTPLSHEHRELYPTVY